MLKKTLQTFIVLFLLLGVQAKAQIVDADSTIQGSITKNLTLNPAKKYLLKGFVYVTNGATITMKPGQIIFGDLATAGTLIISKGAKINANGTATRPVVFTSQRKPGQRKAGDWGGVIILGKAPINIKSGTNVIEGGLDATLGAYGGTDPEDNSGTFRYVRIEFPGIAYLPDNEINGLTLGGVGRGTTIEYVQVSYSGDDSFEWFGGTVNAKYLIAFKGLDDDFDTDFGYSGKNQFVLGIRDAAIADVSGSNCFESDNDGTGTYNKPRTSAIFSNVTCVGPMRDSTYTTFNSNFKRAAHIRRASLESIYNSVIVGYPTGLLIDGDRSAIAAKTDSLQIRNDIFGGTFRKSQLTTNATAAAGFSVAPWYNTTAFGNRTIGNQTDLKLTDPFNDLKPNASPSAASVALTGADFSNARLADTFFTKTTFVGAMGTTRWDTGWTVYNAQTFDYSTGKVDNEAQNVPDGFALNQNYPNPFNPSTTLSFSVPKSQNVRLSVYDLTGREVKMLVNGVVEAGAHQVTFDATSLTSGVYLYRLESDGYRMTQKMTLVK